MIFNKIYKLLIKILNKKEKINFIFLLIGILISMFLEICTIILLLPIFNLNLVSSSNYFIFKKLYFFVNSISIDKTIQILIFTILIFTVC